MTILNDILKLISRLPPEGLRVLSALVKTFLQSKDPMRAVQAAKVAAAKEAYRKGAAKLPSRKR